MPGSLHSGRSCQLNIVLHTCKRRQSCLCLFPKVHGGPGEVQLKQGVPMPQTSIPSHDDSSDGTKASWPQPESDMCVCSTLSGGRKSW